jgi:hypothetical protein
MPDENASRLFFARRKGAVENAVSARADADAIVIGVERSARDCEASFFARIELSVNRRRNAA